jgi:hypothetical protein
MTKINKQNWVFIFLLALPLLTTCKKFRHEIWCKHPATISQKVRDFYYFKDGTYWIYQNETTMKTDSQWVIQSVIDVKPNPRLPDVNNSCNCYQKICYQWFTFKVMSSQYSLKIDSAYLSFLANVDINHVDEFSKKYYRHQIEFWLTTGNLNNVCLKSDNNDKWESISSIKDTNTLKINNVDYSNCFVQSDSKYGIKTSDIYPYSIRSRNVGVIRFKDRNNQYWNLIRKRIIQ